MKKRFTKILSVILALLMLCTALPMTAGAADETFKEGYYTYKVSNGEATITDVDASISGNVTIPSTLGGYPVTYIGAYAFYGCFEIGDVVIPQGVTGIGSDSFALSSITDVIIPDSVTDIGRNAFYWCDNLAEVNIPASVTYCSSYAFHRCENITKITVDPANKDFCSVDGVLYSKDMTTLYYYPEGKQETSYTLPKEVSEISFDHSFENCSKLENIFVESGSQHFTSIDGVLYSADKKTLFAFPVAKNAETYTILDSVETIENNAFARCNISEIHMSDNVKSIGQHAFYFNTSLKKLFFLKMRNYLNKVFLDFVQILKVLICPTT